MQGKPQPLRLRQRAEEKPVRKISAYLAFLLLVVCASAIAAEPSGSGQKPKPTQAKSRWQSSLEEEVAFWDAWLNTGGLQWPDDFRERLNPESQFQTYLIELIDAPMGSTVTVLDVGAGPLTNLGKRWEGRTLNIVAVDPLAVEYDRLLSKYHINPPSRTTFAEAERLTSRFAPCQFDLVHARNSIDHSYDPTHAISEMLKVLKPGRYVYLEHAINEGKTQRYHGLHQWNFFVEGGQFYISSRTGRRINATEKFNSVASTTTKVKDNQWLVVIMRKKVGS